MQFYRIQTRLFCDVYTAYRHLTQNDKILKWSTIVPGQMESVLNTSVQWTGLPSHSEAIMLEFFIMNCTEDTEFCTEIHLMCKMTTGERLQDDFDLTTCQKVLEALREHFNREWIIRDFDLTHPKLLKTR